MCSLFPLSSVYAPNSVVFHSMYFSCVLVRMRFFTSRTGQLKSCSCNKYLLGADSAHQVAGGRHRRPPPAAAPRTGLGSLVGKLRHHQDPEGEKTPQGGPRIQRTGLGDRQAKAGDPLANIPHWVGHIQEEPVRWAHPGAGWSMPGSQ